MAELPPRTLFDLAGPNKSDRYQKVRVLPAPASPDSDGPVVAWDLYGERRGYPDGDATATDGVVFVAMLTGELVEVKPNRRWTIGEWTVTKAAGCGCGGANATLRSFVP